MDEISDNCKTKMLNPLSQPQIQQKYHFQQILSCFFLHCQNSIPQPKTSTFLPDEKLAEMCHVPFVRSFHTYRKTQQHPQLLSFPHSTQINLLFEFVCASCWCKLCLSLDALHNTTLEAVVFLPSCHCYVWDVIERRGDIKKLYVRVCRQSSRSL